MAIFHIPPPRKWSHKHIILVALVGSLVVIAITAAISISLSPAHIFFYIKDTKLYPQSQNDTNVYNFTLVIDNSSPDMEVHYGALSAELWYSYTTWAPAVVDRSALLDDGGTRQLPRKEISIPVSAAQYYWQEQTVTQPGGGGGEKPGMPPAPPDVVVARNNGSECSNCTVLVTASVWFKSRWWISTRWYDVRANCSQVNFSSRNSTGSTVTRCD